MIRQKSFDLLAAILVVITTIAGVAYTESTQNQFKQLVEQLQKSPADTALREKIIKFSHEIKPPPTLPEEAKRRMARGEAAISSAKNLAGYEKAIIEYQAAANVAPWYSVAYFNLGLAQEMANKLKDAMESFRLYILASPDAIDAEKIKKHIYKLEYDAEQQRELKSIGVIYEKDIVKIDRLINHKPGALFTHSKHNDKGCDSCHSKVRSFDKEGFHTFCKECHKKNKGPTKCNECHIK